MKENVFFDIFIIAVSHVLVYFPYQSQFMV